MAGPEHWASAFQLGESPETFQASRAQSWHVSEAPGKLLKQQVPQPHPSESAGEAEGGGPSSRTPLLILSPE